MEGGCKGPVGTTGRFLLLHEEISTSAWGAVRVFQTRKTVRANTWGPKTIKAKRVKLAESRKG